MDKEVGYSVHLAVALLSLAALLSVVAVTIYIGNGAKNDVVEEATRVQTSLETGQLRSLSDGSTVVISKASIYYILSKENNGVKSLKYTVKTTGTKIPVTYTVNSKGFWSQNGSSSAGVSQYIFAADILAKKYNLEGKVRVTVTKESISSTSYDVIIDENI